MVEITHKVKAWIIALIVLAIVIGIVLLVFSFFLLILPIIIILILIGYFWRRLTRVKQGPTRKSPEKQKEVIDVEYKVK